MKFHKLLATGIVFLTVSACGSETGERSTPHGKTVSKQGETNTFTPSYKLRVSENPDSIYFRKLETELSQLTQEQLAYLKRLAEESMEELHSQLESGSLNPEEAHEAMISISYGKKKLKLIDKYLHN